MSIFLSLLINYRQGHIQYCHNNRLIESRGRETKKALEHPNWRNRLLSTARRETVHLGGGTILERAGSGKTRALEVILERLEKACK